jgi:hypothetical protein
VSKAEQIVEMLEKELGLSAASLNRAKSPEFRDLIDAERRTIWGLLARAKTILAKPDPPSPVDLACAAEIVAMLADVDKAATEMVSLVGSVSYDKGYADAAGRAHQFAKSILARYPSRRGVWVELDDLLEEGMRRLMTEDAESGHAWYALQQITLAHHGPQALDGEVELGCAGVAEALDHMAETEDGEAWDGDDIDAIVPAVLDAYLTQHPKAAPNAD